MIKSLNIKRFDIILVLSLLVTTLFFRLWRLESFQYWSEDEQIFWFIVRHIAIDKHLSLVVPNSAIGGSLGPLFHYLVIPWFWVVNFNPQGIVLLGVFFSLMNLLAIYVAGRLLGGKKVGAIAAFLYAASFMSALFDRRLWALTPSIFLVTLAVIALTKILKGHSKYLILLSLPTAFALNSDPSLGIVPLATVLIFIFLRPKLEKRHLFFSLLATVLLLLPLILFDIRHDGQNIKSLITSFQRQIGAEGLPKIREGNLLRLQADNISRFFSATPTKTADGYFCYCRLDDQIPRIVILISSLSSLVFIFLAIKRRNPSYLVLISLIISYLLGLYFFRELLKGDPAFHYSLVISPILFMMAAVLISTIIKRTLILVLVLVSFLALNLNTLFKSEFKYPLEDKRTLVEQIKPVIRGGKFSLYYSGDIILAGGGWTSLFVQKGLVPSKGNFSLYWGHIFESYSLYPVDLSLTEPKTVIVLSENESDTKNNRYVLDIAKVGRVYATIYDNTKGWFIPEVHIEKLYQPKYFN